MAQTAQRRELQLQDLQEMFPNWDLDALLDVLDCVNGDNDEAVSMLLAWSSDEPASPGAAGRCQSQPVTPYHAGELGVSLSANQEDASLPVLLQRTHYDCIIANRLARNVGTRSLAGVLKAASLWRHHAQVSRVALRYQGTRSYEGSKGSSSSGPPHSSASTASDRSGALGLDEDLSSTVNSQSHEEAITEGRDLLRERCAFLGLSQREMEDDGNCQFRAISQELYGSPEHHELVRAEVTSFMQTHEKDYSVFFEDGEWQRYLDTMTEPKTWGDELSLRAAADAFGVRIHLLTSTQENWLLEYAPATGVKADAREVFMTYIAPVHYNTIEPLR